MKKQILSLEKLDVEFCTECGKSLDDFGISNSEIDYDILLKNFEKCKSDGKFKGEICSKLFIAYEVFNSVDNESN